MGGLIEGHWNRKRGAVAGALFGLQTID